MAFQQSPKTSGPLAREAADALHALETGLASVQTLCLFE